MALSDEHKRLIKRIIDREGYDYAFTGYSKFSEVTDEEFHRLRNEFLSARTRLIAYLVQQGIDSEELG